MRGTRPPVSNLVFFDAYSHIVHIESSSSPSSFSAPAVFGKVCLSPHRIVRQPPSSHTRPLRTDANNHMSEKLILHKQIPNPFTFLSSSTALPPPPPLSRAWPSFSQRQMPARSLSREELHLSRSNSVCCCFQAMSPSFSCLLA
jgi:hypothetical protein